METKNFEIKKQSINFTFTGVDNYINNLDRYKAVSLALLTGFYNPMRRFSDSDKPVDIKKLTEFKHRFNELVNDIISEMNIDVEDIGKVKG